MFVTMRQCGAWWKGLTENGVEVAVSHDFFTEIRAKHLKSQQDHPRLVAEVAEHYDDLLGYEHPQWWVDSFRDCPDGVGLQKHTWVRKKNYAKVMLGEVTHRGFNSNDIGSEGTLIFRTHSEKKMRELNAALDETNAMLAYVESFWAERGITVTVA